MRYSGVRELKQRTSDLLREAEKGDIIITAYGKPAAVLHHVDEEALADCLVKDKNDRRTIMNKILVNNGEGPIDWEEFDKAP